MLKKNTGTKLKEKKKTGEGASRELKRLKLSINYDGRKNRGKVGEVVQMLCK